MVGVAGVISSLVSLGRKLLPAINQSAPTNQPNDGTDDLQTLMRMWKRINATLYDAAEREIRDQSVQLWLEELTQVAYAAEDVLDSYHYEVLRAEVEARNATAGNPHKRKPIQMPDGMAKQIKEIRNKFNEINKDRLALQLREEDGSRRNSERHITPTSPFMDESIIFGREQESEELINLLLSCDGNVISVITIVGTGGIGKTTLAQLAYNNKNVRQGFDKFGWICISEDFCVERLTKEVVESMKGSGGHLKSLSALQEIVSQEVRGKRVLLVLDDVWNENTRFWESFCAPFMSAKLVKVLVTTRNEPVARIMESKAILNIEYLPEENCWLLFQHYAFGRTNADIGSEFVEIGKQIVRKCGRLPLSVKLIASLLRLEGLDEVSWREVLENKLLEYEVGDEILSPLRMSYERLPTYLKPCFLYCSIFPKDHLFEVDTLASLWSSQGYIESTGTKTVEEIARKYANKLWERSIFEAVDNWGKLSFRLHDMIHDVAEFYWGYGDRPIRDDTISMFPKPLYHLYVESNVKLFERHPSNRYAALRTLIVEWMDENSTSIFDLSKAKSLRYLQLMSHYSELATIGKMKHLRYLELHCCRRLPECICSLYCLQTLKIYWARLIELPKAIGDLICLEEVSLSNCKLKVLPSSFWQLKALKTLQLFHNGLNELPEQIGNLVNLETLNLNEFKRVLLPMSVFQLKKLRKLHLDGDVTVKKLPSDLGSLTNLKSLIIRDAEFHAVPPTLNIPIQIEELMLQLKITVDDFGNAVGGLKNSIDLGTLEISELSTLHRLDDVQCVDLLSKHNIENLILNWGPPVFLLQKWKNSKVVCLTITSDGNKRPLDSEKDLLLIKSLQPHSNLIRLHISMYRHIEFPEWVGDPTSCASLEEIHIENCCNLTTLSFGSLHTVSLLRIWGCDSLRYLQAEHLPLELCVLQIDECDELASIPGIQKLKSLVELEIKRCKKLKFLLEPEPSTGLTLHTNECLPENSLSGLRKLTSLRRLTIEGCPRLQPLADELLPVESCKFSVYDCPELRSWCLQHRIAYKDTQWIASRIRESIKEYCKDIGVKTQFARMEAFKQARTFW